MNVLVLNYGSSTLKWAVLESGGEVTLDAGTVELRRDPAASVDSRRWGAREVHAVGHRVVHGGTAFRESVRIDPAVRSALASLGELDPLHAPQALAGIDAASRALPGVPHVAVFDTAFHATIPDANALYPLPSAIAERTGARKLGFHGLSVAFAVRRARELLGVLPERLLVMHIGSGASLTAVVRGRSVDTTMGMTPLDGVMMATRVGALDPGLLLHILRKAEMSPIDLERALTERAGLLGVSGVSGDLREVLAAADRGDPRARLAYEMLLASLRRQSGAMIGSMQGLDAVVFTGGAGEGSARLRKDVCASLAHHGVVLDARANADGAGADHSPDHLIGAQGSTPVLVVHAREDLSILREVIRVVGAV